MAGVSKKRKQSLAASQAAAAARLRLKAAHCGIMDIQPKIAPTESYTSSQTLPQTPL